MLLHLRCFVRSAPVPTLNTTRPVCYWRLVGLASSGTKALVAAAACRRWGVGGCEVKAPRHAVCWICCQVCKQVPAPRARVGAGHSQVGAGRRDVPAAAGSACTSVGGQRTAQHSGRAASGSRTQLASRCPPGRSEVGARLRKLRRVLHRTLLSWPSRHTDRQGVGKAELLNQASSQWGAWSRPGLTDFGPRS